MAEEQHLVVEDLSVQPVTSALIEDALMLKDIWHANDDLGIHFNRYEHRQKLAFDCIKQDWFKNKVKLYILYRRNQGKSFGTLVQSVAVLRLFAKFLDNYCFSSFDSITDAVFSEYLNSISKLTIKTQQRHLFILKSFFEFGRLNNWFDTAFSRLVRYNNSNE